MTARWTSRTSAPSRSSWPGTGTTTLTAPVDVSKLTTPDAAELTEATTGPDGADQIAAGLGSVVLAGNGGNDVVGTANDSTLADSSGIKAGTPDGSAATEALYRAHASVLIGGPGSDVMKSGSADDEVYTGTYATIGQSDPGAGDTDDDTNVVDTGTGSDKVYGSNGKDFVTTSSRTAQSSTVYGGAGTDVLTGGLGTDALYGGPDDDYLVASPATVGEPGSATDDLGTDARLVGVLPGAGTSTKLLVGGTGSDRIYGSDGPSDIFGDTTVDGCTAQSDPVSKQPQESNIALDADDLILGGNGVDVVNAGGGDDWVYASGEADRVCGNAGVDRLHAGDGDDLVLGGSGDDQGFGDDGADQVYGNQGDDSLYGAEGSDRLQGNQWRRLARRRRGRRRPPRRYVEGGHAPTVQTCSTVRPAPTSWSATTRRPTCSPARRTRPTSGRRTRRSVATTTSGAATTPTRSTAASPTT